MTKFAVFRLKNEMLIINYIANSIGAGVAIFLTYRSAFFGAQDAFRFANRIVWMFEPLWLVLMFSLILSYERPIRFFLNATFRQQPIPLETSIKARQRLLNEPFFLIALDLGVWIMVAVIYSAIFWITGTGKAAVYYTFTQSIQTGLVTSVAAFFILRSVLQRRLVPHFFPEGGLYMTPKTLRIRISTRLAGLILACNLIPFFAIINLARGTYLSHLDSGMLLNQLRTDIFIQSSIFMGLGIILTILVSLNLRRPFQNIIHVLQAVRNGEFSLKVRVTSNDEIGYTGDVINEMTEGLKERDRMRHSLELAKEVQQHFVPKADPKVAGLDIAGHSKYCERTGGDYYDYLGIEKSGKGKIGVVIGDVSGHGIHSALLMATARSSLRQRALSGGKIEQIVSDVNRQLARDVEESGRFMTLFYCEIDSPNHRIRWVRAGHDPAIFFDPETNTFEELKGMGLALGVDEDWQYEQNQKDGIKKGQIIVLATDGIWEAQNANGEMFGKDAFYDIIRRNAALGAYQILEDVIDKLEHFQTGVEPEDDVTLVVIKFKEKL